MARLNLYTMGYLHSSSKRTLTELIAVGTPIIDIRKTPTSKWYEWTQEVLKSQSGLIYYWIEDLGNVNYASHGTAPIAIQDMERGMSELERILALHDRVCLMCACAYPAGCHRQVVADEAARRFGATIVHLPAARRRAA